MMTYSKSERLIKEEEWLENKRTCTICGLTYTGIESNFYRCRKGFQGFNTYCKTCDITKRRDWYRRNLSYALWLGAKRRAEEKGLDFNISPEDIKIPLTCPVYGLKLKSGIGEKIPESPTLDRLDSSKGYTLDNIQVISWRANKLKADATLEELKALVAYMENTVR